jgi:tryptophan synthase beta chain
MTTASIPNPPLPNSLRTQPDERGHFGQFGGRYVAETLMPLILIWNANIRPPRPTPPSRPSSTIWTHYVGRPSPLYFAPRMTEHLRAGRAQGMAARKSGSSARN